MSSWPLTINGRIYRDSDFSGKNYYNGYPDLLSDCSAHFGSVFTDKVVSRIYPEYGELTVTAGQFRMYAVGGYVKFSLDGSFDIFFYARVLAYEPTTGVLTIRIEHFLHPGVGENWTVSFAQTAYSYTSAKTVPVASGGFAAATRFAARGNLQIENPATYEEEIFEDFVTGRMLSSIDPTSSILWYSNTGAPTYTDLTMALGGATRFGALQIPITGSTASAGAGIGRQYGVRHLSTTLDTEFFGSIYIPNLSDASNRYTLRIGLASPNSTHLTNCFSYGGLGLTYTDNVNTGRWVVVAGGSGAPGSTNSAVTVAVGWNTIRIVTVANTATLYCNGVSVGTYNLTASALLTGAAHLLYPTAAIYASTSNTTRTFLLDYLYLRGKITR